MGLFKKNPFGHILFIKKWIIRVFGVISHGRYQRFNDLKIEGSEIIRDLPESNVLFVSNHQTYFADVAAMLHVFNASLKGRIDSLKNVGYIWNPKLNIYYIAASETMKSGLLPKIFAYTGSISIQRTWRSAGKDVNRQVKMSDITNIGTALTDGWVITFPREWLGQSQTWAQHFTVTGQSRIERKQVIFEITNSNDRFNRSSRFDQLHQWPGHTCIKPQFADIEHTMKNSGKQVRNFDWL